MTHSALRFGLEFSVIIPTRQRLETLISALTRIESAVQSFPANNYEVIVTDDAPAPGAAAELAERFPWVRWTSGPRRGPAANRNHGARQARGAWLVFTDDDCLPDPGWLAAYAAGRAAHPNARVLEGRTYADRPRRSLWETSPINETGGHLWSCNFAIENAFFRELGGFDERFIWATMEDMDLAERLRERHVDFPFVPDAAVCHPWRPADPRHASSRHVPSLLLFLQLHPRRAAEHRPVFYARAIIKGFFQTVLPLLFTGQWRELGPCWHGTVGAWRLMWNVPRISRHPHPLEPGPQPWPAEY